MKFRTKKKIQVGQWYLANARGYFLNKKVKVIKESPSPLVKFGMRYYTANEFGEDMCFYFFENELTPL